MRQKSFLFILFTIHCLHLTAQQNFPGKYTDSDGQTFAVSFPDYKQWRLNPASVKVIDGANKEKLLTPQNTREFSIDGYDRYISRSFHRLANSISKNDYGRFGVSGDSLQTVNGFLLVLLDLKNYRLYKYADALRMNFFIETNGQEFSELKYKVYSDNDQTADIRYKQQLQAAFSNQLADDQKLFRQLERLEYTEQQIVNFIIEASGEKVSKSRRYPSEFSVLAGASVNSFNINSEKFSDALTTASFDRQIVPVFGIGFTEYAQRGFGKNFGQLQLKYYRLKHITVYDAGSDDVSATYEAGILNLYINVGRKLIEQNNVAWWASAGPQISFLTNSKETLRSSTGMSSREGSFFRFNANVQTGVSLKNLGFWLQYHLPLDIQNRASFSFLHTSMQLGVEWRFRKK